MLTFAQEESAENWVYQYIYTDIHKIFFAYFPIVLHEWFSRLETRQTNFQRREVVEWTDQFVCKINSVSNPICRVVDFWVNSILKGYITEFAVETIASYSEAEKKIPRTSTKVLIIYKYIDKDARI